MSALDMISDEEIMAMIDKPEPVGLTKMQDAAPELYEALDACLSLILNQEMQDGFESQQGHMARAALAKARGETAGMEV